ncbi:MAG: pirin family protein [bacterium]
MNDRVFDPADAIQAIRPLGFPWQTQDPFLFCAYHNDEYPAGNEQLGPAASLAGRHIGQDFTVRDGWRMYHGATVPGFPQHPHRGFETVTVVQKGLVDHTDSLGAAGRYGQGDVQWMTAGSGILHAEMFPLLNHSEPNPLELFQIWLNLPQKNKMVAPYFTMLWGDTVPLRELRDDDGRKTHVRVVAGRFDGLIPLKPPPNSWAAQADSDVAIWTIRMEPTATWTLPAAEPGTNRTLYFYSGSGLRIGTRAVQPNHLVEVRGDLALPLTNGPEKIELLLLQGRPIGEPVVSHGPFVMNTRGEIQQTIRDYQRTRFGGWPHATDDPVHPRDEGRFARHADGRLERPA